MKCKHCGEELTVCNLRSERGEIFFRDWETDTNHRSAGDIPAGHRSRKIHLRVRGFFCPACGQESEYVYQWRLLKPDAVVARMGRNEEGIGRIMWGRIIA